jgi:hypothetical protein
MKSIMSATPWTLSAPLSSVLSRQCLLQTPGKWYVPELRRQTSTAH